MKTHALTLALTLTLTLSACSESEARHAKHEHGPHDGMLADFTLEGATTVAGWVEVKLHDDKGDLEIWLGEDKKLTRPFDLPLTTEIVLDFLEVGEGEGKLVTLRPRNATKNEGEDGLPNVRNGNTNYFIFPSKVGEDASWLQGKEFKALVEVRFARDEKKYRSSRLELMPHTH